MSSNRYAYNQYIYKTHILYLYYYKTMSQQLQQLIIIDAQQGQAITYPQTEGQAPKEKSQAENVIKVQKQIFSKESSDSTPSFFELQKNLARCDYLCEALEILIRVIMKQQKWREDEKKYILQCKNSILFVDKQFSQYHLTLTIERGDENDVYSECWRFLLSQLWDQQKNFSCANLVLKFISYNTQHLKQITNKVLFDQGLLYRFNNMEQSPIFSQDSFNPAAYKQKQQEKQLSKYNLRTLLSNQHIEGMKKRINKLKNSKSKHRLLVNLQQVFQYQ